MSGFDIDLVMGPRRAARAAWIVAGCSCAVSVLLALTITVMLPLRETEVFTVLVDSTSGAAERIYQVQPGVCVILCPGAFSYAMGKRSSNMMASWLLTRCHSRTERFHSTEVALSAK